MTAERAPSFRSLLFVFLLSLGLRLLTALPLEQPGYFDAYFYYNVAEGLSQDSGFTASFIWNYLDNPTSIPHPTNAYWMPLTSLIIYPFFLIFGITYRVAQLPFIVLSSIPPVLACYLAHKIFDGRGYPLLAAVLAIFSGFYLPYWVSPDNFATFAVSASLALIFLGKAGENWRWEYFALAGLFTGLSHLSRPDGLFLGLVVILILIGEWRMGRRVGSIALAAIGLLLGYLVVMGPWFLYNWGTLGTPLPSVGLKTLFLRRYEDLFSYAQNFSLENYLSWGWTNILSSKLAALIHNALVILGGLQFFLAPFAFLGLWQARRKSNLLPFFVYGLLLFAGMALLFTFPSMHGSMLHSATALLPFFFGAVPSGLETATRWVAQRRRSWDQAKAARFFALGFTGLAAFFSLFLYSQSLFFSTSPDPILPLWNQRDIVYLDVELILRGEGDVASPVLVVEPPGFWYFTHRPAIPLPSDGTAAMQNASSQFGAKYLILEFDHPSAFNSLYRQPGEQPGLELVSTLNDPLGHPVYIYRLAGSP